MRRYFSEALLLSGIAGAAGLGFADTLPFRIQISSPTPLYQPCRHGKLANGVGFCRPPPADGADGGIIGLCAHSHDTAWPDPAGATGRRGNSVRVRQGLVVLQFAIRALADDWHFYRSPPTAVHAGKRPRLRAGASAGIAGATAFEEQCN